jgi:hypothetical protein
VPERSLYERLTALERSAVRHDKQLDAIRNLLERATRLVIQLATNQPKLQASVTELANSLKRGGNGHT